MTRLPSDRGFKLSAGLVLVPLIVLTSCAWYFRVWNWRDLQVYRMMRRECHPVWEDLHWGRVHSGQDVDEVIAATKPVRVERYGEFVRLSYHEAISYTGVTIIAKNGRLAIATSWSCTWHRVFFDESTPEDRRALSDACETHWQ